ncbi:MAG: glycosyltransferase family 2 protein, partial [Phycisphaerales bacterium]
MNTIKQHGPKPVGSNLNERPGVEIETFGTTPEEQGLAAEKGTIVVSIGILAYNEESSIAGTIESILEQSIVMNPPEGWQVEIVCVPNGCTDRTAEVAGESLAALGRHGRASHVATKVVPLATPSKENAWNRFVHDLSARDATHLVFIDGDVRLLHPDTLGNLVTALCANPRAHVAAAETVKHISRQASKGIFERISMMATGLRRSSNQQRGVTGFAGCLYATPAASSRRF